MPVAGQVLQGTRGQDRSYLRLPAGGASDTDGHRITWYLTRERIGRCNRYSLDLDMHLRYPTETGLPVRLLITIFTDRDLHPHAD